MMLEQRNSQSSVLLKEGFQYGMQSVTQSQRKHVTGHGKTDPVPLLAQEVTAMGIQSWKAYRVR